MNENYSYVYNSHYAYTFRSKNLSVTKRTRLEEFSNKLLDARIELQDIVRGANDPKHTFMRNVYNMSADEFCKLCRNTFNEKFGLTSSCDTQLYTQVYESFANRFLHIRDWTRMKLYKPIIYKTATGEKDIRSEAKVTYTTKLLSYLMNHMHYMTKDAFIEKIEKESSSEPDLSGLTEKEAKEAKEKYESFKKYKEISQKVTPNGTTIFDRLYELANARLDRIFDKYSYPVEFVSYSLQIRVRTQELIFRNTNKKSNLQYFINLGNFDKNGAMVVPIKYSEEFFGDYKRFSSKGTSPSYIVTVIFKNTSNRNKVDFAVTIDGERSKPVLASFEPVIKEETDEKKKYNKRCGSRQASKSENIIEEHYVNQPSKDKKFYDNSGNKISKFDYVCKYTDSHDVNLKHNAISAMLIDENGNEIFKEFDWDRKAIDTFAYLKKIEEDKRQIFETNKKNRIKNLKNKLSNKNLTKEDEEKIKSKIKEIEQTHYKRSKKLQKAFDRNERVMKASRGRLMNSYANWLEEYNMIHDVCEDLSRSFGKQYAKYETKDRKGNTLYLNYNSLMNFCKMTTLNDDLKKYLAKRNICVSKSPAANTSRRCPKCGDIHKSNRLDQETFSCRKCGYTFKADFVSP